MAVKINNCLDLYDVYLTEIIKPHFDNSKVKNNKFLYSPPDLCFAFAYESFGEKILPFYNVFRSKPPKLTSDASSLVNFNAPYKINDEYINNLLLEFNYQIDFFAKNMFDMNESIINFYEFKASPQIIINLKDVGFDVNYEAQLLFDEPEDNHNIDAQFESGRYFRYTYNATTRLQLFKIIKPIEYKITFKMIDYNNLETYYVKELNS